MRRKVYFVLLFLIFLFGYLLRVWFLKDLALTFGYDQARDAIISQEILKGDFKILGPPASTPGLYHGVFYYYLLAPAYLIGNGNPVIAAYWIAFLNASTVFIVFFLTYLMTKKFLPALISSFLFAISFEATQYATWLSNPTIGIWTVPLIYLGLWAWTQPLSNLPAGKAGATARQIIWPIVTAIGLGLSIQSEIFLAYHAIPIIIWLWVSRREVTQRQFLIFVLSLIAFLSSMIVAEIKFGFKSIEGIRQLAVGGGTNLAYANSLGDYLILYLNQIGRIFAFNSYPGNIGYGGIFVIVLAVYSLIKKDRVGMFLATWLFSHITVVTLGGTSTPFLMVGIGPAVSLIIAYYLFLWWQKGHKVATIAVLLILIFGNLSMIFRENLKGATLFAIQKDMLLAKQIKAIDYTYEKTGGENFSVNSLTSPLWINIVWSYLYKWYGLPKYGYLPTWHGKDQIGQLDSLQKDPLFVPNYFLILEPMGGIPPRYLEETINEEDAVSILMDEVYFGELRVQKRLKKVPVKI